MGLFLGNAGVGCPNPAFYVLLTYIASVGSVVTGGWLAFIHGVGRATPLIFLAILGLVGVNALGWIKNKKSKIDKIKAKTIFDMGPAREIVACLSVVIRTELITAPGAAIINPNKEKAIAGHSIL